MYKTVLGLATVLVLAGCNAKTAYVAPDNYILDKTVETTGVTDYTLDDVKTVKQGQPMATYEKTVKTVYDQTDIRFKALKTAEIKTKEGNVYKIVKDRSYVPSSADAGYKVFHIDLVADGKAVSDLWLEVDKEGKLVKDNIAEHAGDNNLSKPGDTLFSAQLTKVPRDETQSKTEELFKQELLYTGLESDNIIISYNEYKNDPETPVASEVMKYNLSASDIIRHKKFKLQVLYTDSEKIKFRVVAGPAAN